MVRVALRLLLSLLGATAAAAVIALLEARDALLLAAAEGAAPDRGAVVLAQLALLLPAAAGTGLGVLVATLVLDPRGPTSPSEMASRLRAGDMLTRLCRASLAPLVVAATFGVVVAIAHAARGILAHGTPAQAGVTLGAASVGLALLGLALVFALLPAVRRGIAVASGPVPSLLDPVLTGSVALAGVGLAFAYGVASGDTGGEGGVLAVLGVLKRPELDLRPASHLVVIALGAYAFPILISPAHEGSFAVRRSAIASALTGVVLAVLLAVLLGRTATSLNDAPLVTRAVERHAALGKVSLAVLRRASDRDHDGFSGRFGGGDCDDRDPLVNPSAVDVPGNGKDEDCSGADTPLAAPTTPAPGAETAPRRRLDRAYNVLLITVDTLRKDLGFMGYEKPVSPNLDALAAQSTVFERAYSLASYTGKSVGPMLIGKYPSETRRNFSHFDTYAPANTFVAERAHEAGVRTFAGHCHWYFKNPSGLSQGFDVWDTSALPPGMGDNDTSITSDRMSASGLALLRAPENTGSGRFFGWLHFFDPHAQYVPHPGSPEALASPTARNLYDQEIWFTDKHVGVVLDYVASQPWGKDTAIIVTADHGEAFGEHGMSWHGREIWEPLVRVPLVVFVPGEKPRRIPVKRSHVDLVPTILELLGVPAPEDASELRGESLLGDVLAPDGAAPVERDVYVDMPEGPFNDVRRALLFGPSPGTKILHLGGGSYQLFDLATDPDEKQDLAKDRARLREAVDRLQAYRGRLVEIAVKKPEN